MKRPVRVSPAGLPRDRSSISCCVSSLRSAVGDSNTRALDETGGAACGGGGESPALTNAGFGAPIRRPPRKALQAHDGPRPREPPGKKEDTSMRACPCEDRGSDRDLGAARRVRRGDHAPEGRGAGAQGGVQAQADGDQPDARSLEALRGMGADGREAHQRAGAVRADVAPRARASAAPRRCAS